jgi:predicted acyl esterase
MMGKKMYEVVMEENVFVAMRDGIKLAVDIYRPNAQGKFPALLSMSPYGKEKQRYPKSVVGIFTKVEAGDSAYFVSNGYVHVIADVRGSSPSEGQWNFLDKEEQQDGYELIEWIAKQPWCNGNVGMIGESYYAVIQYLVAATQPPSLKTIVPFDGFSDLYRDVIYHGGMYHGGFLGYWAPSVYQSCLPDGENRPGKWLPPNSVIRQTILQPNDGPYYWERSAYTKFDKITVPIYHMAVAGHYSHYRGQLNAYRDIDTSKKLLVGPAPPFEMFYNEEISKQIIRWLDYWLKDIDNGVMDEPPVLIYLSGSNEWRYEFEYPLARTKWMNLYLHQGDKGEAGKPPYGLLSEDIPNEEPADTYKYPESQKRAKADLPVLAYLTQPLPEDVEIVGPDGSISVVTKGWLKGIYREVDHAKSVTGQPFHTHLESSKIEPNKVYKYEIELWPIFRKFKAGHRLRLRIASGDSPAYDVMNYHNVLFRPGTNTIYHSKENPSHLVLPIIPDRQTGNNPPQPEINYFPVLKGH